MLAGFPGPVKTNRAFLSYKSDNNTRLLLLFVFLNRNSAIFIFSCETGGKHNDSVLHLSPASPLHFVFLHQILYTAVLQMCCLHGTQLPVTLAGCSQVLCIGASPNASLTLFLVSKSRRAPELTHGPQRQSSTQTGTVAHSPSNLCRAAPVPLDAAAAFYQ